MLTVESTKSLLFLYLIDIGTGLLSFCTLLENNLALYLYEVLGLDEV